MYPLFQRVYTELLRQPDVPYVIHFLGSLILWHDVANCEAWGAIAIVYVRVQTFGAQWHSLGLGETKKLP